MQLIEPLIGGITGAEGGTAEIWDRTDTARAPYYIDFEGTKVIYSGLDIELDAYGSAEIYAGLPVLVRVRSQGGSVVREFTVLGVAHADELDTSSFTADTVGEALDAWDTSASDPDFEVTLNGAPTELEFIAETTYAQMQTVCAVKSFGAVGDGVADDSVAIGKAIAFASIGGGTVLFNAGTYIISSTIVVPGTVTLQGTGPGGTTIIQSSHTARVFSVQSATATAYIAGMTIRYASTSGDFNQYGVNVLSGSRVKFSNVSFGSSAVPFINAIAIGSGPLDDQSEVTIEDCSVYATTRILVDFRLTLPSSIPQVSRCILAMVGTTSVATYLDSPYIVVSACSFSGAIDTAFYVGASGTTGSPASQSVMVRGCSFANPPAGTAVAFKMNTGTNATFNEDGNTFGGSVDPFTTIALTTNSDFASPNGPGYVFRSAEARVLRHTVGSQSDTFRASSHGTKHSIKTATGIFSTLVGSVPAGAVRRAFITNSVGGTESHSVFGVSTAGANIPSFPVFSAGISMANGTTRLAEFVSVRGLFPLTTVAPIVDGALVGPLT